MEIDVFISHHTASSLHIVEGIANKLEADGVRCAVRVYERYSWTGGNRLSMSLTLFGSGSELQLSAITSGGSNAMFFKMNTIGEDAFLDTIANLLN